MTEKIDSAIENRYCKINMNSFQLKRNTKITSTKYEFIFIKAKHHPISVLSICNVRCGMENKVNTYPEFNKRFVYFILVDSVKC